MERSDQRRRQPQQCLPHWLGFTGLIQCWCFPCKRSRTSVRSPWGVELISVLEKATHVFHQLPNQRVLGNTTGSSGSGVTTTGSIPAIPITWR